MTTDVLERLSRALVDLTPDQLAALLDSCRSDEERRTVEVAMARAEGAAYGLDARTAEAFAALGYVPTLRQLELHTLAPWSEGGPWDVLYGGAAGGGKTLGLLMDSIARCVNYPMLQVWAVRATYPELRDSFLAYLEELHYARAVGARWKASEYALRFPGGSVIKFRHASRTQDVSELLSAQTQYLVVDERTTLQPGVVDKLTSRIRTGGRGERLPIIGVRSGSNPGEIGHASVKAAFIDPAPLGRERIRVELPSGGTADRYFIPSRIADNPHLDPSYKDRLSMLPPDLRAAYEYGDWSKFVGMVFQEWQSDLHVVDPEDFPIPDGVERGVGVDYGLAAPFCALWAAKLHDDLVVVYRELYEAGLTPTQQAERILANEAPGERPYPRSVPVWLDPACWARQPSSPSPVSKSAPPKDSIADDYQRVGLPVRRANNDRLSGVGVVHNALRLRADGTPRLIIYSVCTNLIRTLPSLPRSKARPEDVDSNAEDHAYDGLRYLLMGLLGPVGRASVHRPTGMLPSAKPADVAPSASADDSRAALEERGTRRRRSRSPARITIPRVTR